MLTAIGNWVERRRSIRRRWQDDARALADADMHDAYYEAQRRAARASVRNDRAAFYHWAEVAAEVAGIAPLGGHRRRAGGGRRGGAPPTLKVVRRAAGVLRPAREALAAAQPVTIAGLQTAPLPALLFAAFGSCPRVCGAGN